MNVLKANGKEYILKYNFRALSEIQDRGVTLSSEQEFKLKDIVLLIQIGLKKYQPEITMDGAFDLMDELLEEYTLEEIMQIVIGAINEALGKSNNTPR